MDFLVRRGRGLDPAVLAWIMGTLGIGPCIGEVHFLVDTSTSFYSWLRDDMRIPSHLIHTSLAAGEDALITGRNDVLCVLPASYVQGVAGVTWDKSQTHLLGLSPLSIMEHKCVFTNGNADATPTTGNWSFDGDDSVIKNVCFRHRGAAANVINCSITGDNLNFENVHFHNMANAATAGAAGALGVSLDGCNQLTMKRCVIGGTEIERTASAVDMSVGAGTCDNLFFYDCMWIADLDATADGSHAFFKPVADADLAKLAYFENPRFINCGAHAALPDALTVGAALAGEIVMWNPMVVSITDIADNEEKVWVLGPGLDPTEAAALAPGKTIGVAIHPDVT